MVGSSRLVGIPGSAALVTEVVCHLDVDAPQGVHRPDEGGKVDPGIVVDFYPEVIQQGLGDKIAPSVGKGGIYPGHVPPWDVDVKVSREGNQAHRPAFRVDRHQDHHIRVHARPPRSIIGTQDYDVNPTLLSDDCPNRTGYRCCRIPVRTREILPGINRGRGDGGSFGRCRRKTG